MFQKINVMWMYGKNMEAHFRVWGRLPVLHLQGAEGKRSELGSFSGVFGKQLFFLSLQQ